MKISSCCQSTLLADELLRADYRLCRVRRGMGTATRDGTQLGWMAEEGSTDSLRPDVTLGSEHRSGRDNPRQAEDDDRPDELHGENREREGHRQADQGRDHRTDRDQTDGDRLGCPTDAVMLFPVAKNRTKPARPGQPV